MKNFKIMKIERNKTKWPVFYIFGGMGFYIESYEKL